jgi:hypothetical protein
MKQLQSGGHEAAAFLFEARRIKANANAGLIWLTF